MKELVIDCAGARMTESELLLAYEVQSGRKFDSAGPILQRCGACGGLLQYVEQHRCENTGGRQ
jgi:hypothetical protein